VSRDDYVRAVEQQLRDLRWKQRRDVSADLRRHLAELPGGTDLVARLGTPEEYAAELRAAAGLTRQRGAIAFVRSRRPRDLLLVPALAVAAGLVTAVLVIRYERQQFVEHYQPIRLGNYSYYPAHARGLVGIAGEEVVFHPGKPFKFGIEIVNVGRYSVRILGVPFEHIAPWHAQLRMGPLSTTEALRGPTHRFRAFDLQPGQYRFLFLRGVYWCTTGYSRGGAVTYTDFPVRYRFRSHWATASIPLPGPLAINWPNEGCPSGGVPWPKW
jgi:hypothetical protein